VRLGQQRGAPRGERPGDAAGAHRCAGLAAVFASHTIEEIEIDQSAVPAELLALAAAARRRKRRPLLTPPIRAKTFDLTGSTVRVNALGRDGTHADAHDARRFPRRKQSRDEATGARSRNC